VGVIPYTWTAVGAVFLALALALGVQTKRISYAKAETQEVKTAWAADRERAAETARKAEVDARTEEQRRVKAQQEINDVYQKQVAKARADAVVADAAAGRLQRRVAELLAAARGTSGDPAPLAPGTPASDPAGVLADMFRRADDRAGVLARIADERGASGLACERAYDALGK
jgi:hypothetical protein